MKKIVMTGGGTAGHVTPNIALFPALQKEGYEISYIGSYEGIEKRLIEEQGVPYYGISSGKLRRYFDPKNFSDPFKVLKGYHQSVRLLKKLKPDVVFSKGGFVSVPVVLAASRCHIPAIIHESDLTPGLANRIAIPKATKVCCNFPETMAHVPEEKAVLTGTPIHETAAEAEAETQQQLNCYADVCEQDLAIPVVKGRKTDKEKFAGAEATYTIEAMMKDGKALQSGTSHYFGDKFSKAYDVTFTGRDNQLHHPYQTSWGVSTRLVGAIIMTHGDDDGLILPPAIAPIQVVVVPIAAHKPGVSEKAAELAEKISKYARVKLDDSDNAPGWKFAQWEMKGVPLRLEIGPKDLEKNQCVLVRRDTREKVFVSLDELETAIPAQLEALRKDLYQRALENREKRTWAATTMDEVKELAKANTGYIKTMWCGDLACEMKMKEEAGLSSRCMPFEQEQLSDVCPCCGKPAKAMVYWGVAY